MIVVCFDADHCLFCFSSQIKSSQPFFITSVIFFSVIRSVFRAFETQMTRMEAEFVQREAPPSYGQLIAQGLIPPVEDFPVYNPTQVTHL